MDYREHIETNPKVMLGKPVVKGTRLTVEKILELMSQGATNDDLVKNYPQLTKEKLMAVFSYLAHRLQNEEEYFNQAS